MIGVALKGLLGRKLRATLTAIAIVLGVAMVSGTYILTDTIKSAFSTVFTRVYRNTDAVITGKSAVGEENGNNERETRPTLPASLLPRVQALPGVALCQLLVIQSHQGPQRGAAVRLCTQPIQYWSGFC